MVPRVRPRLLISVVVAAGVGGFVVSNAGAVPRPVDPTPFVPSLQPVPPPVVVVEADALPDAFPEPIPEPPLVAEVTVDCTPIEESGWRNGRRTPVTLIAVDHDRVERTTANAYLAMRKAAAADGVELVIFSAFRSEEEQRYFYECFKTCSCNSCAPAAKPGFSNHQMGRAIDIAMWPGVHDWLALHAGKFGFAETVRGEPWHWELRGKAKPPAAPMCPEPPRKPGKKRASKRSSRGSKAPG